MLNCVAEILVPRNNDGPVECMPHPVRDEIGGEGHIHTLLAIFPPPVDVDLPQRFDAGLEAKVVELLEESVLIGLRIGRDRCVIERPNQIKTLTQTLSRVPSS